MVNINSKKRDKKEMKTETKFVCIVFSLVLLILFSSNLVLTAQASVANVSTDESARLCVDSSKAIMSGMIEQGFNVIRVNDSFKKAQEFYIAQKTLRETKKNYDFSTVLSYCDEIKAIQTQALSARDELDSVKAFYKEVNNSQIDLSKVDLMIADIQKEINDERYEQARQKIDAVYNEIVAIQSSATTLSIFYRTTSRTLLSFLKENWLPITIGIVFIVIFLFFYRYQISKWLIQRKINHLEMERAVLKKLIEDIQKEYFQGGTISDSVYNIRTKRFSEMIRDLDRQVPLLKEELAKISLRSRAKSQSK